MTALDSIKRSVGLFCWLWTVVPWVVSVFPSYLPWLHRKFRYLLLKPCNGCWLWQSEETLSYTLAPLVWYMMDWFWSLSFLLRSCFQSQVEWGCGHVLLLVMDHVSLYLLLMGEAKSCSAWGESTDYTDYILFPLSDYFLFWLVCFIILLWSLFEFGVISPSLILKIMEKAKKIRKMFKECFELQVEALVGVG